MSVLSSLVNLIRALISRIWKSVWAFIKEWWWLILLIVIIYFAPAIATFLAESTWAPVWLTNFMSWVAANVSTYVVTAVDWLISGALEAVSAAWDWYLTLGWEAELIIALGAAYAIAPEETTELVTEAAEAVGEFIVDVASAAASGLASSSLYSYLLIGAFAYLGYKLITTNKSTEAEPVVAGEVSYGAN